MHDDNYALSLFFLSKTLAQLGKLEEAKYVLGKRAQGDLVAEFATLEALLLLK